MDIDRYFKIGAMVLAAQPALADLEITFREGAPVDRFIIENTANCDLGPSVLRIDLSQTRGGLIFDVTGSGAGVEVFQPLRIETGDLMLSTVPVIADGDTVLDLEVAALPSGERLIITVDLDDTIGSREITVSGSEFSGATVRLNDDEAIGFVTEGDPIALLDVCGQAS